MFLAKINTDGTQSGLWNDPATTEAPNGLTELAPVIYAAWCASPASTYAGGLLTPPPAVTPLPPTLAQQAAAALAQGAVVTSAATPALNGTYAVDTTAQARLAALQTRINAGLGLPLGLSTVTWIDMAGEPHTFTAAQFTSLAHAVSDYVYALDMLSMGQGTTLPSSQVTIP